MKKKDLIKLLENYEDDSDIVLMRWDDNKSKHVLFSISPSNCFNPSHKSHDPKQARLFASLPIGTM